jgi:GntR family transcriptional regulator
MVKEYNTSRATIDKVVELLTAEGYLEPSDGNRPPIVADFSHRNATVVNRAENRAATGRALGKNETTQILSIGMVPCPPDIAHHLGVQPGEEVLRRQRLNLIDGKPVATGFSYYPPEVTAVTPELARSESIPSGSRELAAERMGSTQAEVFTDVTSRLASDEERQLLDLKGPYPTVGEAVRRVLLANGRVVEVGVKIADGKRRFSFHNSL